jgi:hypothetical protein
LLAAGDDELTHQQEQAVLFLLTAKTVAAAAKKMKVSPTTIFNWLKTPAFRHRLAVARREVTDQAISVAGDDLAKLAKDAIRTLKRNLTARGNPAVQVRAATVVLDKLVGWKAVVDLHAEIEELKAMLERRSADDHRTDGGIQASPGEGGASPPAGESGTRPPAGEPGATVRGDGVDPGPVAGEFPLFDQ